MYDFSRINQKGIFTKNFQFVIPLISKKTWEATEIRKDVALG